MIIDGSGVVEMDLAALAVIDELVTELAEQKVEVFLASCHARIVKNLEAYDLLDSVSICTSAHYIYALSWLTRLPSPSTTTTTTTTPQVGGMPLVQLDVEDVFWAVLEDLNFDDSMSVSSTRWVSCKLIIYGCRLSSLVQALALACACI